MNKKASHVGAVLSFVIFITFVIFLYSIIVPTTQVEKEKESLHGRISPLLIKEISSNIYIVTISKQNQNKDCIEFDKSNLEIEDGLKVVVKDSQGNIIDRISPDSNIFTIDVTNSEEENFWIYFFKGELVPSAQLDVPYECSKYTIQQVKEENYIFEIKINELKNIIEDPDNYLELKNSLGVNEKDNFGFIFKDDQENIIESKMDNENTNIFAQELPIQYIDENAETKSGFINIKVW